MKEIIIGFVIAVLLILFLELLKHFGLNQPIELIIYGKGEMVLEVLLVCFVCRA